MGMVERVARAFVEHLRGEGAIVWEEDIAAARAAIEAMREPTEVMLPERGVRVGFFSDADGIEDNMYVDKDEARDVWRAMVDAALNEQVSG